MGIVLPNQHISYCDTENWNNSCWKSNFAITGFFFCNNISQYFCYCIFVQILFKCSI